MSTVGVFGVQFNGWYEEWIDGWFDACLSAGFDQVVLASDRVRSVPAGVQLVVCPPCDQMYPIPYFSNLAVEALGTEWCWNMDIDDVVFPSALREIKVVDADVYAAGLIRSDGVKGVSRGLHWYQVAGSTFNPVNAGSAFKKWLWFQVGGYPDIGFHDWGLWRLMGRAQARFACSGSPDYLHRVGHNSVSKNFNVGLFTEELFAL